MKIGFVLDDGLDSSDGVQQYILTVGTWLIEQGHEVHYLVGQTDRTDISRVHSLAYNVGVRFNQNRLAMPIRAKIGDIKKLLKTENFDVLHVQMPYSPLFAGKVLRLAPHTTAIVGTFHILPYGRMQAIGASLLARLSSGSVKRIDAVVSVSAAAQVFAVQAMKIDSTVVPNAIDLNRFKAGSKMTKFTNANNHRQTIIFLGRLVERKGCLELLAAVKLLVDSKRFDNRQLVICGDGPLRSKIEAFISANTLSEKVQLVGRITEEEKPDYLASADLAVFPSKSGESFGIVLVEAIASGATVTLGGDNPGYRSVLSECPEALINPVNTQQFADRIDVLLSDTSLAKSIGAKQRQQITKYDVAVVGQQLIALYDQAIALHKKNGNNKVI